MDNRYKIKKITIDAEKYKYIQGRS